ncbi:GNAT family N-acetyltransferase [Chitinimonas viridis]|uniref:GNAT family N-acetyltransferase n=1 Tax=Chitinimonas viridis TaxID=664880 RepID=A0ABT8BAP3_9NEIS|nr:GNAT family N-acetyltransferase [Chitinimonas viridis]MDN3579105.1 GNAT family N-acetyltransferase [Chitinimonas viridis]
MRIYRMATEADREAVYRICLLTGDAGRDASAPGRQEALYGHLYAGPYLSLAPEHAWVAEDEEGVCGYALGCANSATFYADMERAWLPPLRERYRVPQHPADGWLINRLQSVHTLEPRLAEWPAHLHVDLLPRVQGQGVGGVLMEKLMSSLRAAGAPAVHLGVDPRNERAVGWYARFGFVELFRQPGCIWLGRRL